MKNYSITVNGNVYDVTVEEKGAGAGSVQVTAGAAGKVVSIDSKVGDAKKKGETIMVLEVMKMETPVVAPQDGTVASIDTAVGNRVEAGELLATLN